MDLSVAGARQGRKHNRLLPLADTERQSSEAFPRQGAERVEGLGKSRSHQHGEGADLCDRHFRTEGRRQMSSEHGALTGQVIEQCRRGRPRQAEAADPPRTGLRDVEGGLRDHRGIQVDARTTQGSGVPPQPHPRHPWRSAYCGTRLSVGPSALAEAMAVFGERSTPNLLNVCGRVTSRAPLILPDCCRRAS